MMQTRTEHNLFELDGLIAMLQEIREIQGNAPVLAPTGPDNYRRISHLTLQQLANADGEVDIYLTIETFPNKEIV